MTVFVSGAFSLGIVVIVNSIERHLVSEEMHRELNVVLHEDLKNGRPPRLDSETQFYASNFPEYAIPEHYGRFGEGFTEVVDGDQAFYVYAQEINGARYILVQDQREYEAHEKALFDVVFAGFIFTVLGAWLLGRAMAGRVMVPLSHLAQQVQHRDQLLPVAPPLAPEYPNDEIGQLAKAFDSTLNQLRQSLERERLFTNDVSHELRTPLTIIATSSELLGLAPLAPQHREQLQRIERASHEMRDLVQTFLQLARDDADKTASAITASLAQVAEQQCKHWRELIETKGIEFELIVEGQDDGQYNPTLLGTVMANLLRNALHYTDRGHVRLFLETGGFRVEDSGTGISEELHESIFLPFFRGAQARGEGLGLGLSLARRICLHQGWNIAVCTLLPAGSCFRVRFDTAP